MIPDKYKKSVMKGKSHWLERRSSTKKFVGVLREHFKELEEVKVLDAGCAQGRDSKEISSYGIEVVGLDYNDKFIAQARKDYPGVKFDVGKIEYLPYQDKQFDAVYCVNTLFYTNPKESLPELERVLKRDGILFMTLDEKIVDLNKDEEIHSLDIDEALKNLKDIYILRKDYQERVDEEPFRHKHFFYEVIIQKI